MLNFFRLTWLILLLIMSGFLVSSFQSTGKIQTDIFTIIPSINLPDNIKSSADQFLKNEENKIAVLLTANTKSDLVKAQNTLLHHLEQYPALTQNALSSETEQFFQHLYSSRYLLLSDEWINLLSNDETVNQSLQNKLQQNFLDALSFGASQRFTDDPLGLFESFINQNTPKNSLSKENSFLTTEYQTQFVSITSLRIEGSVFNAEVQENYQHFESQIIRELDKLDVNMQALGVIHHATRSRLVAIDEISTIGSLSLLGILVLFLVSFRSIKPIVYALLVLSSGLLCATSVTLFIFSQIHILTLVFGASVIGIAIDYAFHFFAHFFHTQDSGSKTIKHIRAAIVMGLLTSVFGFSSLSFTGFPALQQLSAFAIGGLAGSFLTVVLLLSLLPKLSHAKKIDTLKHPLQAVFKKHPNSFYWVTALILLSLTLFFVIPMKSNDDIRMLRIDFPQLEQTQKTLQSVTNHRRHRGFIVVQADSAVALLEKERLITKQLEALTQSKKIEGYQALSQWLPAASQLQQNQQLVELKILNNKYYYASLLELGLTEEVVNVQRDSVSQSLDLTHYQQNLDKLLQLHPLKPQLLVDTKGRLTSQIFIETPDEFDATQLSLPDGSYWYDKVGAINHLFGKFRSLSVEFLSFAYLLVAIVFCLRYGIKTGVATLLPSIAAITFSFLILTLYGVAINLFHILATIIVLAVGIDFSLFINEAKKQIQPAILAATLSAITTLLAFGLLSFSQTVALASFGQIIFMGIIVVYLLAPLSLATLRQ